MSCTPIISYRRFGGVCCRHRQGKRSRRRATLQPVFCNVTTGRQETSVMTTHTKSHSSEDNAVPAHSMQVYVAVALYRGSSFGIETCYGLDGPDIESQWCQDFPYRPQRTRGPPNHLYNGYRVLPTPKAAGAWC